MIIRKYVLISTAAAVCAIGVVGAGAALVLPMVCTGGLSADSCLSESEAQDTAPAVAMLLEDVPAPADVAPAAQTKHEPRSLLNGRLQELQTRRVKIVPVRPDQVEQAPIVGSMSLPVPVETASGAIEVAAAEPAAAPPSMVEPVPVAEVVSVPDAEPLPITEIVAVLPTVPQPEPTVEDDREHMIALGSNVRAGPSKQDRSLFVLASGADVVVGREDKGWFEIEDEDGRSGWVYRDFLKPL